jgi:hypothetical protein
MSGIIGRPTVFCRLVGYEVIAKVADGNVRSRGTKEIVGHSWRTVYRWRENNKAFDEAMLLAESIAAGKIVEWLCLIAEDEH